MDSPLNKVILIRVVQQQTWWFLSKIFMESQRLKVGKLSGNFKESYKNEELEEISTQNAPLKENNKIIVKIIK